MKGNTTAKVCRGKAFQTLEYFQNMAPSVAQEVLSEDSLHEIAEVKLNRAFDPAKHTSVSDNFFHAALF